MSVFSIFPMERNDVKTLAELEQQCFSQPWNEQMLGEELDNRTAHFLVAKQDGVIAGYIGVFVVCESCYISNIAVFPCFRRQGAAKLLLQSACEIAFENGAESVSLEVRPSNNEAVSLYAKMGFEEVGLRKNFYRKPVEDALILTKTLS